MLVISAINNSASKISWKSILKLNMMVLNFLQIAMENL